MSNLISIGEFKQLYIDGIKDKAADLEKSQIRMFAMGKELKDDLFLYSYSIMNDSTVQVMIKKS